LETCLEEGIGKQGGDVEDVFRRENGCVGEGVGMDSVHYERVVFFRGEDVGYIPEYHRHGIRLSSKHFPLFPKVEYGRWRYH